MRITLLHVELLSFCNLVVPSLNHKDVLIEQVKNFRLQLLYFLFLKCAAVRGFLFIG